MSETEQHDTAYLLAADATDSMNFQKGRGETVASFDQSSPTGSVRTLPFGFSVIPVAASQGARRGVLEHQPTPA